MVGPMLQQNFAPPVVAPRRASILAKLGAEFARCGLDFFDVSMLRFYLN
jgi:hypothetical protein